MIRRPFLVLLVLLGSAAAPALAHSGSASCGDTLLRSTRLSADLRCAGNGLMIGADDITLDCDGHALAGDGSASSVGIRVEGHSGVKVKNCRVSRFAVGIELLVATGNEVEHNKVSRASDACFRLVDANGNEVEDNRAERCGIGLAVVASHANELEGNSVSRAYLAGISLLESDGNRIEENVVVASGIGFDVQLSRGTRLRENLAVDNRGVGYRLLQSRGSTLDENRAHRNNADGTSEAGGFFLADSSVGNVLHENLADDNEGYGFYLFDGSDLNLVKENAACGNEPLDAVEEMATNNAFVRNDFCKTAGWPD